MKAKTLKACPFCGGGAELRSDCHNDSVDDGTPLGRLYTSLVVCVGCGACGPEIGHVGIVVATRIRRAVDSWNRRAAAAPPPREGEG